MVGKVYDPPGINRTPPANAGRDKQAIACNHTLRHAG